MNNFNNVNDDDNHDSAYTTMPRKRMNPFTARLLSNASHDYYPDNKLASFKTVLPDSGVQLKGHQWEVALTEIAYPTGICNVTEGQFIYHNKAGDAPVHVGVQSIEPGSYGSLDEIANEMIKPMQPHHSIPIQWNPKVSTVTGNSTMTFPTESSKLEFVSDDLANIFGYPDERVIIGKGPHYGKRPVDLQRIHQMVVNIDCIEDQIFGDKKLPVLRTVGLFSDEPATAQSQVVVKFDTPEYKRIKSTADFHTIQVELRGEDGHLIPFLDKGCVQVTLHFRPVVAAS